MDNFESDSQKCYGTSKRCRFRAKAILKKIAKTTSRLILSHKSHGSKVTQFRFCIHSHIHITDAPVPA